MVGSSAEELVRLHCLYSIRAGCCSREQSGVTRQLVERLCGEGYRGLKVLQSVESAAEGLGRSPLGGRRRGGLSCWPDGVSASCSLTLCVLVLVL